MSNNIKVLLVGCGYMGREYYRVLKAMKCEPVVIGRGESSAEKFRKEFGVDVKTGGVDKALAGLDTIPGFAIVAVTADQLCNTTAELLNHGVSKILVEKPAGMNRHEISKIKELAERKDAEVFVAYNRRFYASTEKALEIIKEDGGLSSLFFEFTEWSSSISKLNIPDIIKTHILLGNSTHVIDLAFFLAGLPREISSYVGGGLPWHPNGSRYSGAGVTRKDIMFSYCANWEAPGRWSVEAITKSHRLYFKPMEKLSLQKIDSVAIEEVEIQDQLDREFKPGLYKQVEVFFNNRQDERLITIHGHLEALKYYEIIAGISGESRHVL